MSIRKMLRPVHTAPDSPVTSPENARHHNSAVQSNTNTLSKKSSMQVLLIQLHMIIYQNS